MPFLNGFRHSQTPLQQNAEFAVVSVSELCFMFLSFYFCYGSKTRAGYFADDIHKETLS